MTRTIKKLGLAGLAAVLSLGVAVAQTNTSTGTKKQDDIDLSKQNPSGQTAAPRTGTTGAAAADRQKKEMKLNSGTKKPDGDTDMNKPAAK
jgi:hypothetical protein